MFSCTGLLRGKRAAVGSWASVEAGRARRKLTSSPGTSPPHSCRTTSTPAETINSISSGCTTPAPGVSSTSAPFVRVDLEHQARQRSGDQAHCTRRLEQRLGAVLAAPQQLAEEAAVVDAQERGHAHAQAIPTRDLAHGLPQLVGLLEGDELALPRHACGAETLGGRLGVEPERADTRQRSRQAPQRCVMGATIPASMDGFLYRPELRTVELTE